VRGGRAAIAVLCLGAAGAAFADRGPGPSLASACQLDVQLFCPKIGPESARPEIVACLDGHLDALTEECRAVIAPASVPKPDVRRRDPLAAACQDDFVRLCGHEADRMAFARCVRTQRAKLSGACRDALDARAGPGASHGGPP